MNGTNGLAGLILDVAARNERGKILMDLASEIVQLETALGKVCVDRDRIQREFDEYTTAAVLAAPARQYFIDEEEAE